MELVFSGDVRPGEKITDSMTKTGNLCLTYEGLRTDDVEVSVSFVDMQEIKELNRLYRGIDKTTDVLSFPQYDSAEEIPAEGRITLGDVVICTEQALIQADEFGHSEERELVYLFVHSMLHLLGYDHEEKNEKGRMREEEEKIMLDSGLER